MHPFIIYLLYAYYLLGTVLVTRHKRMNKIAALLSGNCLVGGDISIFNSDTQIP